MTVNGILDAARAWTHTTSGQFPNTTLIDWANIVYRKLVKYIVKEVDENYFVTTRIEDAVATQTGYDLQSDVLKIKAVRIKPTTTANLFVPTREVDFSKMLNSMDYYMLYQSIDDPIHQVIGNKLYIAPYFTSSTITGADNNQIEYDYEQRQTDLSVGGAESTVKIPTDYHHVIAIGIKPYIFSAIGKFDKKNDAINEFRMEREEMVAEMTDRDMTKNLITIPNDSNLE